MLLGRIRSLLGLLAGADVDFFADQNSNPHPGAHALTYNRHGTYSPRVPSRKLGTRTSNSTIIVGIGRGDINSHTPPTDNMGNVFVQLDTAHPYIPRWPRSGTALYAARNVKGRRDYVATATNASNPIDEVTLAVVQVVAGDLLDAKWNFVPSGSPLTSLSVTITAPATLVAFWWGDGDGTYRHTAVPNNGFHVIDSLLLEGNIVQCAVAVRNVNAPGTYDVTWTATVRQGAQLWLVALQKAQRTSTPIPGVPTSRAGTVPTTPSPCCRVRLRLPT